MGGSAPPLAALASPPALMAIAGHLSRTLLEHYSHIRMAAKRVALDLIATLSEPANIKTPIFESDVHQFGNQIGMPEKGALCELLNKLAGTTGLEPATSCVTGMRSNQLNYVPPKMQWPVVSG